MHGGMVPNLMGLVVLDIVWHISSLLTALHGCQPNKDQSESSACMPKASTLLWQVHHAFHPLSISFRTNPSHSSKLILLNKPWSVCSHFFCSRTLAAHSYLVPYVQLTSMSCICNSGQYRNARQTKVVCRAPAGCIQPKFMNGPQETHIPVSTLGLIVCQFQTFRILLL